jgi:hypothetical protein
MAYRVIVGRHPGKRPAGETKRRWEIVLKYIMKNWDGEAWTGLLWIRRVRVEGAGMELKI